MRGELFGHAQDASSPHRMSMPNRHLLKVALDGEVLARQGAMIAYQGHIGFAFEGSGGVKRLFKKAFTGEGVPLMRCTGQGELYLARAVQDLHMIDLEGESLTVNGTNVVAFEPTLTWHIRKVDGATLITGDVFNMVFTGTGRIVLGAHGTPFVLDVSAGPTYADIQSAIAWSTSLTTRIVRTAGAGALIGRGSGEAVQLAFTGTGRVVIQSSEGPAVGKHKHSGIDDLLG